jgi:flagellum-specific ATP synthase
LQEIARKARSLAATYEDMREMIRIGAYRTGASAEVDAAIDFHGRLEDFLRQSRDAAVSAAASEQQLVELLSSVETIE